MNKLRTDEQNLESQLKDLRMKFNYKKEDYFRKEFVDPSANRNSMDIDTESVSQMSVSSDLVETPIEDYVPLAETVKEENECDKMNVDNQNNNLNDGVCDETIKKVSVVVTQETIKDNLNNTMADDLNSNNMEILLSNLKKSDDLSNNNSNIVNSDFNTSKFEDKKSENLPHVDKANQISESVSSTNLSNTNITIQSFGSTSETVSKESLEVKGEEGNIKEMALGIRKSKSESISLKDSDLKLKKQKETNRYSLYDFQEAPVLIDQVRNFVF